MEFSKVVKERRSVRKFKNQPIEHEIFEKIVDLARFSPSWKNTQIARYLVIESPEAKAKMATPECTFNFTYNINTLEAAPAVVVLTYIKNRSGFDRDGSFSTPMEDRWQNFDCGIAAQTFCLAAHEQGVGTVILGYFDHEVVAEICDIPKEQGVAAVIACGYPEEEPNCPKRKEVGELLSFI